MCESTAYLLKDGKEELVFEGVDILENRDDGVRMVDVFGEEKILPARVKRFSLVDHRIILEPV
ncbi:MAG: CooT family nickel-binding protein [Deltaproteobacteria bacterium]|nr:CooT family nickel-binding protein [Deltaproteobacteria bacterium]MBW2049406.1 CooT family nickel-binding protein [Deltaproteobacteria bacterium]MBW2353354.1 CooT family nickel-binding protein [Deltaproteobacteria bacterium]HDZ89258.1 CooT family nickel-binding protein [Deltaproteobacteria bacterium]